LSRVHGGEKWFLEPGAMVVLVYQCLLEVCSLGGWMGAEKVLF